eukprot:TRINITY_DN2185_c0_g1_i1.p1 TRINITY_DN2185_c0_g1~~TRINITY_DN2185_c0_g1_i1.p1  ORF type:complete len:171 (-),score=34.66 TRINITY_DN2185_c0_g1_i1:47-559(-)
MSRQQKRGQNTKQPQNQEPPENPIQELVRSLLDQSINQINKKWSEGALKKSILELEKVLRATLKISKSNLTLQRLAVMLTLGLQQGSRLSDKECKKLISVIFTYLVDEVQKFWFEYGVKQEEVHEDYKKLFYFNKVSENGGEEERFFEVEDISELEYRGWEEAVEYLEAV